MTDDERAAALSRRCGEVGCIETFLSGYGFERDYARPLWRAPPSSQVIIRAAAAGYPHAVEQPRC